LVASLLLVLAASDALVARAQSQPPDIVDLHVHVAGLGAGGSGCLLSEELRENFRFGIYLWAMDVTEEEVAQEGDALVIRRLSARLAQSRRVDKAVVLALDGVVDDKGALDEKRTEVYVPNEYVARETRRYDNLLFGASVNPGRSDALERLEWARANGAVQVKWIPSIMAIDPADPAHEPFYEKLVELGLPLLTHSGQERSFSGAHDAFADPRRLELPLRLGVTVIAAHIATTGESEGEENFDRILPMFEQYPNLYADISSLTQINKRNYLVEALARKGLPERLVYGTDWPLQFFPLVSPWFHFEHLDFTTVQSISGIANAWDQDVALKEALGTPAHVFTRSGRLIAPPRAVFSPERG